MKKADKSADKPKENIHADHRKRLRASFLQSGIKNMQPHVILELLLFFSIPRIDTNPVAHRLLNHFGNLNSVFNAPYESLLQVDGIGEQSAIHIKLIGEIIKYYSTAPNDLKDLDTPQKIGDYLLNYYKTRTRESLLLFPLDNQRIPITMVELVEGETNSVAVPKRKISEVLHRFDASYFILAHNHPHASSSPSSADIALTLRLDSIFKDLEIPLLEHIVVGQDDYTLIFKQYIEKHPRIRDH